MSDQVASGTPLDPPPISASDPDSIELLRLWASNGVGTQVSLRATFPDPGAWGLILVDIARHVSNAYVHEGIDRDSAISRIKAAFDAEWDSPTDIPSEMA